MLDRRSARARATRSRATLPTLASTFATVGTLLLLASPLAADRLVTTEGSVIETRGPWEVRGKTVVFTTPKGTLSSVRASEIDFEATETANQPAPETPPAAATTPTRRESVLVLTDDDIGRGQAALEADNPTEEPEVSPETGGDPSASPSAVAEGTTSDSSAVAEGTTSGSNSVFDTAITLEVRDWRVVDDGQIGGVELVGTVINRSTVVAVDLGVTVRFEGQSGEESHEAFMGSPMVGPGRVVDFRIPLPSVISPPDEPTFEVHGRGLRPRVLGGVDEDTEDEAEENDDPGEG